MSGELPTEMMKEGMLLAGFLALPPADRRLALKLLIEHERRMRDE